MSTETKVFVDHTVTFHLAEAEKFVVPRRAVNGYAKVDSVKVRFLANGKTWVWAGGMVCKKDGDFRPDWGRTSVTVHLPDEAPWIERARLLTWSQEWTDEVVSDHAAGIVFDGEEYEPECVLCQKAVGLGYFAHYGWEIDPGELNRR